MKNKYEGSNIGLDIWMLPQNQQQIKVIVVSKLISKFGRFGPYLKI
jgi:hypothetical protein